MEQQRKDSRETFRLAVLAHEAHAEVDIIFGWKMNSRTRNLVTKEEQIIAQSKKVGDQIGSVAELYYPGCQQRV